MIIEEAYKIGTNESEDAYIIRVCEAGLADHKTWFEIANIINYETERGSDESTYRRKYKAYKMGVEYAASKKKEEPKQEAKEDSVENATDEISERLREMRREKMKVQTEKLEYNRWLREHARDEMIADAIITEVRKLKPIPFPDIIVPVNTGDREAVLMFGDEHYGAEFEIKGLSGEIINAYSPEIFEKRMTELLGKVIGIIEKEGLTKLKVYSLGDFCDGVLRVSQLRRLRYGVVESTVRYANYIANWLNELSKHVNVEYQMTYGNHSELRFFNQPKGSFVDENTGLFTKEIIKMRLEGNPNFKFIENPTGLIFDTVGGKTLLGIHGEVKNMSNAIKDFSLTYNTNIDIMIGGHLHHYRAETVGIDKDVWNVPSIVGSDHFSMTLNKTSRPGALLSIIDNDCDQIVKYLINLK